MTDSPAAPQPEKPKVAKLRSPSYPGINLETAIRRSKILYDKEKRNAANVSVVAGHWGMNIKSSGALIAMAALKSFGLVKDDGGGPLRTLKLTELALRILLDQRSESAERAEAIKQAALNPKIHAELWTKYGIDLPSDGNLRHALIFEWKFNENSVSDFISEYKDTIAFANLGNTDTLSLSGEDMEGQELPAGVRMETVNRQPEHMQSTPLPKTPLGQPVGSSIPVTRECSMTILATGNVTQAGITQLIAYLTLIKGSFPGDEAGS